MNQFNLFALALVVVASLALLRQSRRFLRTYITRYGEPPPARWMFTRSADPELEEIRRQALFFLPFYLIAVVLYLLRP